MRYLFGFMCVLALGVMGCGTTSTDGDGGSAGDGGEGGSGGPGGTGGIGGGLVRDCTGVQILTPCRVGSEEGYCIPGPPLSIVAGCCIEHPVIDELPGCYTLDCSDGTNGSLCFVEPAQDPGVAPIAACEDGECKTRVSDCTSMFPFVPCVYEPDGAHDAVCALDWPRNSVCVPTECEGLEDGTQCYCDRWAHSSIYRAIPVCECFKGSCEPTRDCSGKDYDPLPSPCTYKDDPTRRAECYLDACWPLDCEGLEDRTVCVDEWGNAGSCVDGRCETAE